VAEDLGVSELQVVGDTAEEVYAFTHWFYESNRYLGAHHCQRNTGKTGTGASVH
jgi:hypothetical protein